MSGSTDHNYDVRVVESFARYADIMSGDFIAFKHALVSLEQYLQDPCSLLNLDSDIRESLSASFAEQKRYCEVTSHLLNNVVSRYDRFLNLVLYLHPHSNG